jgi:hypothetical protein
MEVLTFSAPMAVCINLSLGVKSTRSPIHPANAIPARVLDSPTRDRGTSVSPYTSITEISGTVHSRDSRKRDRAKPNAAQWKVLRLSSLWMQTHQNTWPKHKHARALFGILVRSGVDGDSRRSSRCPSSDSRSRGTRALLESLDMGMSSRASPSTTSAEKATCDMFTTHQCFEDEHEFNGRSQRTRPGKVRCKWEGPIRQVERLLVSYRTTQSPLTSDNFWSSSLASTSAPPRQDSDTFRLDISHHTEPAYTSTARTTALRTMVFPLFGHVRQKWLALLGRAAALITGELLAHAAVGAAAVITLSHAGELLGLALPAWVSSLTGFSTRVL